MHETATKNFISRESDRAFALSNPHKHYCQYWPFELLPDPSYAAGKDPHFQLVGTGTVPTPTFNAALGGGVLIATRTASAAANDEAGVLAYSQSSWSILNKPASGQKQLVEWQIRTPATITSIGHVAGLKLTATAVVATDDDQVIFHWNTAASHTTWQMTWSNTGVDETVDTKVPVAANTNYRFSILLDGLYAFTYVNGVPVNNGAHGKTGLLTSGASLTPYAGVVTNTNAARQLGLRWVRRWMDFL